MLRCQAACSMASGSLAKPDPVDGYVGRQKEVAVLNEIPFQLLGWLS